MGTGKTLSALSVVSNFKQNAIVICPGYLKFVWRLELKKWKIPTRIDVYSYEEFEITKTRRKDILIVDEVHKLPYASYPSVAAFEKRILLSGTPINRIIQLAPLMSILGKPITMDDFIQKFAYRNPLKTIFTSALFQISDFGAFFGGLILVLAGKHVSGEKRFYSNLALATMPILSAFLKYIKFHKFGLDWNYTKIAKKLKSRVSYVPNTSIVKLNTKYVEINYDNDQLDLYERWMTMRLNPKEAEGLGIAKNEGFLYMEPRSVIETMIDKGRVLGWYSKSGGSTSGKGVEFLKLIENIIENNQKAMVFTEIETTATIVKVILNEKKVKFSFVSSALTSEENMKNVRDFDNKTTILLNHGIIEGMSVTNCNNVILLEPPSSPDIYAQAIARVRRHDSHISVPKYVNSYLLISTISKTTMKQKKVLLGINDVRAKLTSYLNTTNTHGDLAKALALVLTASTLLYAPRETYLSLRKRLLGLANLKSSEKRLLVKEFDELASDTSWEESTPDVLLVTALKESSSEIEAIELALAKNNIQSRKNIKSNAECPPCDMWPSENWSASINKCMDREL